MALKLWTPATSVIGFCVVVGALGLASLWVSEPPPKAAGSACFLRTWSLRERPVRLDLESGGVVHVPNPTACVVIDDGQHRTLVRVTEGPYKGMTGWADRDSVGR